MDQECLGSNWSSVTQLINKSFKKCCISNALDGTEDDFIYEDDPFASLDENGATEDEAANDDTTEQTQWEETIVDN